MKLTKNFWRVITLALALVMMFSVVACSNAEEPAATTEAGADSTAAPTTQAPTTEKPTTATTEKPTTAPTTEGTTAGTDDPVTPPEDLTQPDVWDGTKDTSWYDKNDVKTEYTFTTAEQFAGFIDLRQTMYTGGEKEASAFEGITFKLARDLIINEGTAEEIKALHALGQAKQITPLNSNASFKGIFDGQGHTIQGAYIDCPNSGVRGIFGGLGDNAVIKNLTFTNAYFNGAENADGKHTGGIVAARANGQNIVISNVKVVDALMDEGAGPFSGVGLIIGKVDAGKSLTIENCSASGTISYPVLGTNGNGFGGIIGYMTSGAEEKTAEDGTVTPATTTVLVMKNCTSSASITAPDYVGGLIGKIGDRCEFSMDYRCKFTGTIECNGFKGTYVGSDETAAPVQPVVVPELTVDDFSAIKYPEFDSAAAVIEASSAEAGSVSMVVSEGSKYNLFNKDNVAGAAAHGIYKLAQGTNPDGSPLFHYYIDFGNVNKKIESIYGVDYKIASVDDCYIRWTFTVAEAGTYTFGSYMRLKNNADRRCMIQIDDQAPFVLHYTLTADEVASVNDDAATTQGAYMLWDGVEVELEAGEHLLTYSLPSAEYRLDAEGKDITSSWHWRTIYVMKKAA